MYLTRTWLNSEGSPSTGSVVAFHGPQTYDGKTETVSFLEVADCQKKVRLYRNYDDDIRSFIIKLQTLANVAGKFASYLDSQEEEVGTIETVQSLPELPQVFDTAKNERYSVGNLLRANLPKPETAKLPQEQEAEICRECNGIGEMFGGFACDQCKRETEGEGW
jgi:hypothetical protein